MTDTTATTSFPHATDRPVSQAKALRRLFLTLFLRGRSARGLHGQQRQVTPSSIGRRLAGTLLFYGLFGLMTTSFLVQAKNLWLLAVYLHAMTFIFLGLFISASSGEILFNKEEADILLHRPVDVRTLLWAKISVLLEISLWIAGAFNLVGLVVGVFVGQGSWRFPLVHAASISLEALFCAACVILVYQLCIRWFGRERLEGLLTTTQILVSILAVLGGQVLPQMAMRMDGGSWGLEHAWWLVFMPPAWFAALDDALAGSGSGASMLMSLLAVGGTGVAAYLAFGKLAGDYQAGVQRLSESVSPAKRSRPGRRWLAWLVEKPPLAWCLRNPVTRASFLLTTAYLLRDREVKLRVYPSLAPLMVMPFVMVMQGNDAAGAGFGVVFCGAYLGVIPMLAASILQYSQQWQAADIFRAAPVGGPAAVCHGASWAVLCWIAAPMVVVFGAIVVVLGRDPGNLWLLAPGVISLPVYAILPAAMGQGVPLSVPTQEGKAAGRGLIVMAAMMVSMIVGGLATWARVSGWFAYMLGGEVLLAAIVYWALRRALARRRWPSLE